MLYRAQNEEEMRQVQEAIIVFELACNELKGSKTLQKLIAAVLKTADLVNRITIRQQQQLRFLDGVGVKHIPPQVEDEELRFLEGVGVKHIRPLLRQPSTSLQKARTANNQLGRLIDDGNEIGMEVILRLPSELSNVTRAGGLNAASLMATIPKLVNGLPKIKAQVQEGCFTATQGMECKVKDSTIDLTNDSFQMTMKNFVRVEESDVTTEHKVTEAFDGVKGVSAYFYGESTDTDDSRAFSAAEDYFSTSRGILCLRTLNHIRSYLRLRYNATWRFIKGNKQEKWAVKEFVDRKTNFTMSRTEPGFQKFYDRLDSGAERDAS